MQKVRQFYVVALGNDGRPKECVCVSFHSTVEDNILNPETLISLAISSYKCRPLTIAGAMLDSKLKVPALY